MNSVAPVQTADCRRHAGNATQQLTRWFSWKEAVPRAQRPIRQRPRVERVLRLSPRAEMQLPECSACARGATAGRNPYKKRAGQRQDYTDKRRTRRVLRGRSWSPTLSLHLSCHPPQMFCGLLAQDQFRFQLHSSQISSSVFASPYLLRRLFEEPNSQCSDMCSRLFVAQSQTYLRSGKSKPLSSADERVVEPFAVVRRREVRGAD